VLLLIHVIVSTDDRVIVPTLPVFLFSEILHSIVFLMLFLFVILFKVASDNVEVSYIVFEVLPLGFISEF
jgi:hypothetical protein